MSSSRRWRPRCLPPRSPRCSNWCARGWPRFIKKIHSRRSICANASAARMATLTCMTHKKTHKESKSMPSAAKKLAIVHNDEPAPETSVEVVLAESSVEITQTEIQPVTRAEIEEIRGVVTATGTLDVLLKTGWIRPRGRRKAPGRPLTYGTTEV